MKFVLEIQENKVPFVLELLKNFKFVKVVPVKSYKDKVLDDISEAIEELNQIKAGEMEGILAKDILDEL